MAGVIDSVTDMAPAMIGTALAVTGMFAMVNMALSFLVLHMVICCILVVIRSMMVIYVILLLIAFLMFLMRMICHDLLFYSITFTHLIA
jgi:hypothetical protein